jgi:polyisoprenoid-binding protein YceI
MAAIARPASSTITWNIDPTHSNVQFSVKHMGLMTVRGHFEKVTGTARTIDGKLESVEATIDASSINTRVADRDNHLRSPDFFNTEKWPDLKFRSTNVEETGRNHYKVRGDLTMAGQTHEVVLDVQTADAIKDPWGKTRSAAEATTQISRKEWGLTWNTVLETGGLMVSDEVKITLEIEATAE